MSLRTESLVLSCIGYGKHGSTLKSMLSSMDYLNRGVLDRNTLEDNLNLLFVNGFILIENNKFYTTEKAIQFYKEHKLKREGCIAEWIRLSEPLAIELQSSESLDKISISEDAYNKALGIATNC